MSTTSAPSILPNRQRRGRGTLSERPTRGVVGSTTIQHVDAGRYTAVHAAQARGDQRRADFVYAELYDELLQGRLPYGVALAESKVAQRFGVSRTPAREALRRLEADGHLVRQAGGGLAPRPPVFEELRDHYALRVILEVAAIERATLAASPDALFALRDEWEALRAMPGLDAGKVDPAFVHVDESFHVGLAAASGNAALVAALERVNSDIRLVRSHDFREPGRIVMTIAEHLEILDAVLDGSQGRAVELLRAHIDVSAAVVERLVSLALSLPFEPVDGR